MTVERGLLAGCVLRTSCDACERCFPVVHHDEVVDWDDVLRVRVSAYETGRRGTRTRIVQMMKPRRTPARWVRRTYIRPESEKTCRTSWKTSAIAETAYLPALSAIPLTAGTAKISPQALRLLSVRLSLHVVVAHHDADDDRHPTEDCERAERAAVSATRAWSSSAGSDYPNMSPSVKSGELRPVCGGSACWCLGGSPFVVRTKRQRRIMTTSA